MITDETTWTCHAGDVPVTVTAPAGWAVGQRRYLDDYLPGPAGTHDLPGVTLSVDPDDKRCRDIVWQARHHPAAQRLHPVPGVAFLQTHAPSGVRCYVPIEDNLERQEGTYAFRVHDRHVAVFLRRMTRNPHGLALRAIREVMMRTYEDSGSVILHAAGVDLTGHGVVICGPHASGKTTVLTSLLRGPRRRLLSNDRLLLDPHGRLVPVPLPVLVGRGTVDAVAELSRATGRLRRPQPPPGTLPVEFGAMAKVEFTPTEYATALDAGLASGSRMRTLVVPRLSDTAEPVRTRELTTTDAKKVLTENCLTPRDEFWRPWLIPRATPDDELERHAYQVVDQLAPSMRCLEIRFGVRNPIHALDAALDHALRRTP